MKISVIRTAGVIVGLGAILGGCASTPWPRSRAQIETPATPCQDFQVQIYFDRDSAEIPREGRSVLASAQAMAKGCQVKAVQVVGLADAVGAPGANLDLSRRRGDAVRKALGKAGFKQVVLDVTAAGEAGATTAMGAVQPLRRRADIRIEMGPWPRR
ncbi:OmpA family protein [Caulobacter sp. B11]|uniref:OmpA family protein n=1 Tax=Caulobacter sp. B11 TaxID=2048899 RepID=UPI001F3E3772|nr:OmpA family protein [Caulobacter sp. B11]